MNRTALTALAVIVGVLLLIVVPCFFTVNQASQAIVLRFGEIIELVSRELKPHHLCGYLYDLATKFSGFFEKCPVLQSEEPTRSSRLLLCDVTARTLSCGLDLLGIEHPEQM